MSNEPSQLNTDLAALLGFAVGNRTKASEAIAQAKQGLGIDKATKSLTADDKAAIIQWHKERLSLSDNNQLDIETIAPAVPLHTEPAPVINESIEPAPTLDYMIELVNTTLDNLEAFDKLEASRNDPAHIEQVETATIPLSQTDLTPVEIDINRFEPIADDTAITERYDFNAMVQLSVYVGARKQCHIALSGFYLNALMTMAGCDKKGCKEWVQSAVDNWTAFDAKLNVTKQIESLIVRELESQLIKARK